MKMRLLICVACVGLYYLLPAAEFSSDFHIQPWDTSYDGQDIVITNCTVTIDGPHSFASLRVLEGGVLTHTADPDGVLMELTALVYNEPYVFTGTNPIVLARTNAILSTIQVKNAATSYVYANGVDYIAWTLGDPYAYLARTETSSMPSGAPMLVSYQVTIGSVESGLNLTISNDVAVTAGGKILADARGYTVLVGEGSSAGNPLTGAGGGNGAFGGMSSSNAPGVFPLARAEAPTSLGRPGGNGSGGPGGPGGGLLRLVIGGSAQIDGLVSANGANATNSRAGGGAGGSVWISAATLSGTGQIRVNGGAGEPIHGGGGSGGRIRLDYATNNFTGPVQTFGGPGFQRGGAGTIWTQPTGAATGDLLIHNGGLWGAVTLLPTDVSPNVVLGAGAVAGSSSPKTLASIIVRSNASLSAASIYGGLTLTTIGDAVIEAGGTLNFTGKAPPGYNGPGTRQVLGCGGGGHGGYGGAGCVTNASGGYYYGSTTQPTAPGSNGGGYTPVGGGGAVSTAGGLGGAAVRLSVGGTLRVDGTIAVDGESSTSGGGGSGGSIWVSAGTLAGAGKISAIGGSADPLLNGGGSGGRIAIYYDTNLFVGSINAEGGIGFQNGAAGTIYRKQNAAGFANLLVKNNGSPGTNTSVNTDSSMDLVLEEGASVLNIGSVRSLTIRSNCILSLTPQTTYIYVTEDVLIEKGAAISADGISTSTSGVGRYWSSGYPYNSCGGGGGYGGFGGSGVSSYNAAGGTSYGYPDPTLLPGSMGGRYYSSHGGLGGGGLQVSAGGKLQLDGRISADGMAGLYGGAGGGSGGTVILIVSRFFGGGVISASGGAGELPNGGGGGGGRIAVKCSQTNGFSGTMVAKGGPGFTAGGAGTIYVTSGNAGQLTLDNGGILGAASGGVPPNAGIDFYLRGGAWLTNSPGAFRNIVVGSNSSYITPYASAGSQISVYQNVTIEKGGSFVSAGSTYSSGGAGRYVKEAGGGGGNGGYGGNGSGGSAAAGGMAAVVGSVSSPSLTGGSGGIAYNTADGAGGGAIKLTVTGLLRVDGALAVNGAPGLSSGNGGGAGGSAWITVGGLAGSGLISADGASGDLPNGGGGGGGRVAIYYTSNTFAGAITARGGAGYVAGGAGTVYMKGATDRYGRLVADNGGVRGTNTLLYPSASEADVVVQGGAVATAKSPLFVHDLHVHPTSALYLSNMSLVVLGNATIYTGGLLDAKGTGAGPSLGAGAGDDAAAAYPGLAEGGSYGGLGGLNTAYYGILERPLELGSGGGNCLSTPMAYGGSGGGLLDVQVIGTLRLDGLACADGNAGALSAGGGSGGAIKVTAGKLVGSGTISASGGPAGGNAGGGGGGRIAIFCATNEFLGVVQAKGGPGAYPGGAGTMFFEQASGGTTNRQVVLDNGGLVGASTPILSIPTLSNLRVQNGATTHFGVSSIPVLANLTIASGGKFTAIPLNQQALTSLVLSAVGNVTVEPGGSIDVSGAGYWRSAGPGAGTVLNGEGSGAGYGGAGGASMGGAGGVTYGTTYGSEHEPIDFGSGGGSAGPAGSKGGGVIRLRSGGVTDIRGSVLANGESGLNDNSGGGSGGSIWITSSATTGDGVISACGGDGELFNGGGGGGGRIAINAPANSFAGTATVLGGNGAHPGGSGTVYVSAEVPGLTVSSQTPSGLVMDLVSSADLVFTEPVNPGTIATSDFALFGPTGALPLLSVSAQDPFTIRLRFDPQSTPGDYRIEAGPGIENLFGIPMSQVYTGTFSIQLPTVSGKILDSNGHPVAGVVVEPTGSLPSVASDAQGNYTLGLPYGWSGNIAPFLGTHVVVPGSRTYTNLNASVSGADFRIYETIVPQVVLTAGTTNLSLGWWGIADVTYNVVTSSNLVDWVFSEMPPFVGTNGNIEVRIPVADNPKAFYRVGASTPTW